MPRPSRAAPRVSMIVRMLSPIEPRCTGMCGALAISAPVASNSAQEKSSRSLMLTEVAVACSATPISSAIAMNRLLKISSITGSASVPIACARSAGAARVRMSVPSSRARRPASRARPPWSDDGSMISAGPSIRWSPRPGLRAR